MIQPREENANQWIELLGEDRVVQDSALLQAAETATFETWQRIPIILEPRSAEEVSRIVQLSSVQDTKLYITSQGKNWGLGSRVPVRNNSILVSLSKMDKIVEFNEDLSFITLEPGVTFADVKNFLDGENSKLFLSVIGGSPEASVLANALERGEGLGPLGDRANFSCSLQVVLANGEIVETGFSDKDANLSSQISRTGSGPGIEGLFFQSNLGVVTRITIWLNHKPKVFQAFVLTFSDDQSIESALPELKNLQAQGIIQPNSLAIWNRYKILASQTRYPWKLAGEKVLEPEELLDLTSHFFKNISWMVVGALYSGSRLHARADRILLKQKIRRYSRQVVVLDSFRAKILRSFAKPLGFLSKIDIENLVDQIYFNSFYLGNPSEISIKSVYWRKKSSFSSNKIDPDRDRCGLYWLCNVLPYRSKDFIRSSRIVEQICKEYQLEPNIAYMGTSERKLHMFSLLVYDREVANSDENASKCYFELARELEEAGYSHYRLGIQNMPSNVSGLVHQLKNSLDPKNIISPGRYE